MTRQCVALRVCVELILILNLRDEPQVYVSNKTVNQYLQKNGAEALPITLVDGEIAVSKDYPTTKQMSEWTGINLDLMPVK